MGPVTTNPWLISIINMTIVFGVLAALGVLMKIIQLVDPTQKKTEKPVAALPHPYLHLLISVCVRNPIHRLRQILCLLSAS